MTILILEQVILPRIKRDITGTSLVAQWLRIRLPMQGTWVRSLVWEDPTCHGATKPMHHNYWACALELAREPQLLSPRATTTEAHMPRARALQQKQPPQWEACALQRIVAPLSATRESPHAALKTQSSQK